MVASLSAAPSAARISASALRRALIAGMRRVVARREQLNKINVFPVPDGDTGSNLAFTLGTVLAGALSRRASGAGELLRRVADDAIDGARGNSGAILAQFLQGAGDAAGEARVLTPALLARAALAGSQQARGALAQPREGTILSVIRAFAESFHQQAALDSRDWRDGFARAVERARAALADTPKQLAVLRQAGVVDAGAQGFVDLLEGIEHYLMTGAQGEPDIVHDDAPFAGAHLHEELDPAQRWCTECLVEAAHIQRDVLRAALLAIGAGSLVIAGSERRVRVHAHVADPGALFVVVSAHGNVSARKAEDMRAQHRTMRRSQQVAIVTDSGADLPREVCEALDIHMVPVRVNFGAEDFLDKVSLSTSEFYARLKTSDVLPQTSQPPPGDFRRQFEFLLAHHSALVYLGISRAVSGTLQSGESAAVRVDAARALVADTGHASCGQGLIVIAAARAAAQGATPEQIRRLVDVLRPRTFTYAIARDISFGVRGGRVPAWAGPVVKLLAVTPVAKVRENGTLGVHGALWGRRDAPRRFAAYVAKRLPGGKRWRVLVGHCDSKADATELLAALRQKLDLAEAWLVEAGPAIGAHAGPRALVVALQDVDE